MNDPGDNLDAVSEAVQRCCTAEVFAWWQTSFAEFNAHAGRKSLSACLGVEPYAQQFSTRSAAKAARDKYLRSAYAAMAHPSIRSFQTRLQSFLVRTWPNVQAYTQPPERLTTVERELFYALKIGRVPVSVGGIQKILFTISGE